ncbi:MAG: DUF3794 domain-containing protein [Clostridia bacterium]|nr:DUF3794 domain-containing protein [Clostridia bacterium]
MENIFGSVKADYIVKLKTEQIAVDCVMDIPEDKPISEILGKSADASGIVAEQSIGVASLSGKTNFKLIYRTGESDIHALDYFSSFSTETKLKAEAVDKLFAFGKVLSVEIISQKEKEIKLKAIVEIDVLGAIKNDYATADNLSLCRKTKEIKQTSLKNVATATFDIYEEFETGTDVENILLLDGDLVLSSSKTGRDCILVSGTATTNVSYTSSSGVYSKTFSMPFCEEVQDMDAHPDNDVYLYGQIKESRIVLSGTEEKTVLRVEITVELTCPVFESQTVETLCDAFDVENDVTYTKKECICYKKTGEWNFEERLSGSAKLGEDSPLASRIITTLMAKNVPSSVLADDDKINVEGIAVATVIYEDIEGVVRSVEVELPYALSLKADGAKQGGEVYIRSAVCDVTSALKRSREIEVMYLLRVYAYECEREKFDIIDSLTVTPNEQSEMPALVMYMGGTDKEDFEIAKSLKVKPENVIRGEEEFILCYRRLDI